MYIYLLGQCSVLVQNSKINLREYLGVPLVQTIDLLLLYRVGLPTDLYWAWRWLSG